MELTELISLSLFATVAAFTPGPNNLLLAASSANFGLRATWPHMAGVIIGFTLLVAIAAFGIFEVEPYAAGVMVAASALPVAGNVFILAQHYGVAPQRVSAAILISTAVSILTVTAVIAWVS